MFSIKLHTKKEERSSSFQKTIGSIVSHICDTLSFKKAKIISDSNGIEVTSGEIVTPDDNQIYADLLIKKTIVIDKDAFDDKEELDKFLLNIKHFCDQAKNIEDVQYLPLQFRKE